MSPKVDFYILNTSANEARLLFLCRLIEKAYLTKHRLFAYCEDKHRAEELDERLWTFQPESFIPHHLQGEGPTPPPPIQIGINTPASPFHDILLNLTPSVPEFYYRFKRVIEVIDEVPEAKILGRTRYRSYQTQGCVIQTHHIDLLKTFKEPACDAQV